MTGQDEQDRERRLREAAVAKVTRQAPEPVQADDRDATRQDEAEKAAEEAARNRAEHHSRWVDMQVRAAMDRGEFDNLPGAGKPLNLPDRHDPDWWVKGLIEREKITGVLPPALALRKEDAELDAEVDRLGSETEVRRTVADFNRRVVEARRQLQGGPPVVTPTRDPDEEITRWQARRAARRARGSGRGPDETGKPPTRRLRRWLRKTAR